MQVYSLRAELINSRNTNQDSILFERTLYIRYLRETGRNDEELNIHLQDISALSKVYEIETADFFVTASQRLKKAQEYIRRINYRYDWIQVKVNKAGKVLDILNKEELKERWSRLKVAIRKDYKGDVMELGLTKIDKQLTCPEEMEARLSQYFYFGLLFPEIPQRHKDHWTHQRVIGFSDYENEMFNETITHTCNEENVRHYALSGDAFSDSHTTINSYEGSLCVRDNNIFPENATLKIEFERDHILNQWSFNLLRYN